MSASVRKATGQRQDYHFQLPVSVGSKMRFGSDRSRVKLRSSEPGNEKGRCRDSDYKTRINGFRHFMETTGR